VPVPVVLVGFCMPETGGPVVAVGEPPGGGAVVVVVEAMAEVGGMRPAEGEAGKVSAT